MSFLYNISLPPITSLQLGSFFSNSIDSRFGFLYKDNPTDSKVKKIGKKLLKSTILIGAEGLPGIIGLTGYFSWFSLYYNAVNAAGHAAVAVNDYFKDKRQEMTRHLKAAAKHIVRCPFDLASSYLTNIKLSFSPLFNVLKQKAFQFKHIKLIDGKIDKL